jgi:hypothetical protein
MSNEFFSVMMGGGTGGANGDREEALANQGIYSFSGKRQGMVELERKLRNLEKAGYVIKRRAKKKYGDLAGWFDIHKILYITQITTYSEYVAYTNHGRILPPSQRNDEWAKNHFKSCSNPEEQGWEIVIYFEKKPIYEGEIIVPNGNRSLPYRGTCTRIVDKCNVVYLEELMLNR